MLTNHSIRTQRRYLRFLFFSAFLVICWFAFTGTTGEEYIRILLDYRLPSTSPGSGTSSAGGFGAGQKSSLWALDSDAYQLQHDNDESARFNSPAGSEGDVSRSHSHVFRDDGLVEVNVNGPHPIFELIERSEKEWNERLARASTTLGEAVREYRRRYKRNPPKGFDKWWAYVQRHQVLLPDEYDTIYEDLEPFWGLDPADLQQIHSELEDKVDSFTIGKESDLDKFQVLKTSFREEANHQNLLASSKGILDLLGDFQDELPPLRATFSPHDNPNRLNDYGVLSTALQAASAKKSIPKSELPPTQHELHWLSACSPDSPARQMPKFNLDEPAPRPAPGKTFIYNHKMTMDPCLHPQLLWQHGQFLSHHYGPKPQTHPVPEFSLCSTTLHGDIRYPLSYMWVDDVQDDLEWDAKIEERLGWRGSTTGIFANDPGRMRWRDGHRFRVVKLGVEVDGEVEVLMTPSSRVRGDEDGPEKPSEEERDHEYEEERQIPVGQPRKLRKSLVNPALLDLAFTGEPHTCEPSTCKTIADSYAFRHRQSNAETFRYKYLLDIDGNGWSGRFKRLITSNSLVFKSTIYPEWFVDRIQPWVHYVPVQMGMEDLYDVFMFFRGDACGHGSHEDLGKKIAMQGKEWSKRFWRREDLVAYFYRLMLEYVRVISLDREGMTMSFDPENEE